MSRSRVLADAYSSARFWVGTEESLERTYRLEPGPNILRLHAEARLNVYKGMAIVSAEGGSADRAIAAEISRLNSEYELATIQLFDAVDRGDSAAAIEIDQTLSEPMFSSMQEKVFAQAEVHADFDDAQGKRLLRIESLARWVTSLAVGVGFVLIGLFGRLRRQYARESDRQAKRNAHQAAHDALTGLPNRLHFARVLERELATASRTGGSVGVVLLDLDRFKEINDTLGHRVGDRLLQQVGPRLREVLRGGQLIARLGGDEFGLLLPTHITGEDALCEHRATVQNVLDALHVPFIIDDVALAVDATGGLAAYPQHAQSGEVLLQRADIAMYAAKSHHERLAVYDPSLDAHNPRKLALLSALRHAVRREELVLHYQPLIELATLRVRGVEALVRWQHPTEGLLSPAEFVPLAEGSGFIHELTRCVLTRAAREANRWRQGGQELQVSVNISARCLLDINLPDTVTTALSDAGLPARLLKLEITESAIIADPTRAQNVISRLHALGVALSIDDFGTGYTSLAYLRDLPVQEMKIDQSFVMRMLSDRKDAVIVRTSIELARRLGLDSVAEGIEDAATQSALQALGCTIGQGHHMSRPLPAVELTAWLENWNSTHRPVARGRGVDRPTAPPRPCMEPKADIEAALHTVRVRPESSV